MVMAKILDFIEYHENSLMEPTQSWYGPSSVKPPDYRKTGYLNGMA